MIGKRGLILAYGNPAREDDGLGPALAEELQAFTAEGLTISVDYQLSLENALDIASNDYTIFMDASINGVEPFSFYRIFPKESWSFTDHSIKPETLAAIAEEFFCSKGWYYGLGVRGYSFEMFKEKITEKGMKNLISAKDFLIEFITEGLHNWSTQDTQKMKAFQRFQAEALPPSEIRNRRIE